MYLKILIKNGFTFKNQNLEILCQAAAAAEARTCSHSAPFDVTVLRWTLNSAHFTVRSLKLTAQFQAPADH
jgi:hypothetical protein